MYTEEFDAELLDGLRLSIGRRPGVGLWRKTVAHRPAAAEMTFTTIPRKLFAQKAQTLVILSY